MLIRSIEPENKDALAFRERIKSGGVSGGEKVKKKKRDNEFQPQWGTPEANNPSAMTGKTPEALYEYGSTLFSRKSPSQIIFSYTFSTKFINKLN